jgi:hemoglobin-like flavoprotein
MQPHDRMTSTEIRIVQSTWLKVLLVKDIVGRIFYDRLFELDPSLRPLFSGDIREQGQKLVQVIDVAVNGLTHLEKIVPVVEEMGRRHTSYGVAPQHYEAVETALLWTLQQSLDGEFTIAARAAWTTVYEMLASIMISAAASESTSNASREPGVNGQKS